jgi:hypothetical protein
MSVRMRGSLRRGAPISDSRAESTTLAPSQRFKLSYVWISQQFLFEQLPLNRAKFAQLRPHTFVVLTTLLPVKQ